MFQSHYHLQLVYIINQQTNWYICLVQLQKKKAMIFLFNFTSLTLYVAQMLLWCHVSRYTVRKYSSMLPLWLCRTPGHRGWVSAEASDSSRRRPQWVRWTAVLEWQPRLFHEVEWGQYYHTSRINRAEAVEGLAKSNPWQTRNKWKSSTGSFGPSRCVFATIEDSRTTTAFVG